MPIPEIRNGYRIRVNLPIFAHFCQAFVEQLLRGLRLTLNMDGVGLDVHAKLDQKCRPATLRLTNIWKKPKVP